MSDLPELNRQLTELEQQRVSLQELWKRRRRDDVLSKFGDNPKVRLALLMLEDHDHEGGARRHDLCRLGPSTDQERQEAMVLEIQIARVLDLIRQARPSTQEPAMEENRPRPEIKEPDATRPDLLQARATRLKKEMHRKGWKTVGEAETETGVNHETLKRILDMKPVKPSTIDKLREHLPQLP